MKRRMPDQKIDTINESNAYTMTVFVRPQPTGIWEKTADNTTRLDDVTYLEGVQDIDCFRIKNRWSVFCSESILWTTNLFFVIESHISTPQLVDRILSPGAAGISTDGVFFKITSLCKKNDPMKTIIRTSPSWI